jgi:hypothetical protein
MTEIFLILCLAHLAADFPLQSGALVKRKARGAAAPYLHHGATHFAAIMAVAALSYPSLLARMLFYATCAALVAAHLLIDFGKQKLAAACGWSENVWLFSADQALHLATIAAAAAFFSVTRFSAMFAPLRALAPHREKVLGVLVVYFAVTFAGGYLIRFLTRPLTKHLPRLGDEDGSSLRNAGMYIGWLERSLVLTALLLRSPATVGLVLAAKSIARFPELGKSERFAEYFLIGTLLSLLLAIFAGILLLRTITGHVNLAP